MAIPIRFTGAPLSVPYSDLLIDLADAAAEVDDLKKWERSGSTTMVNREAHYQALMAVKDHVLKYVTSLVMPMKDEEVIKVPIAGCTLTIRKLMNDMYTGTVVRGTDIIHSFDRTTIPQIAGQLQSLLELYDPESIPETSDPTALLLDKLRPVAEQAENGMVAQLIAMLGHAKTPEQPATPPGPPKEQSFDGKSEIDDLIREANEIAEQARMHRSNSDPRAELEGLKQRVREMLERVEAAVKKIVPITGEDDTLMDTLHQMQQKHDLLADRAAQELNILNDKIKELTEKVTSAKKKLTGEKTITITVS